ncbi:MAG: aminomethyl-transferring glycine dehydrogenase [Nostocoides sp.]
MNPTPLPEFASRHIGPRGADVETMLARIGSPSLEALTTTAVPGSIAMTEALSLDPATSEAAVVSELRALASKNQVLTSMIGQGYYGTHVPAVVQRNVLENPAWYTAYTPYQPEISQGRLEALLNFQTMIADLTGLDVAGSSLLDEGTAAAEAMTLMRRSSSAPEDAVLLLDRHLFGQTKAVIGTRSAPLGIERVEVDPDLLNSSDAITAAAGGRPIFGIIVQYPGADGAIRDFGDLAARIHELGGLVTAAADLLALTLLRPPGEWGGDVAIGTSQRFGVPMGFGGPHAGYIAVRSGLERTLPGRLVGVSVDAAGAPAYRLALQTREQHIRREKATSNICTAQVLLAVMASMFAVYHGPDGLRTIARRVAHTAGSLKARLEDAGYDVGAGPIFDTVTVSVPGRADEVLAAALEQGINLWRVDADHVSISVDETTTDGHIGAIGHIFGLPQAGTGLPAGDFGDLARTSEVLTHPVFHQHRSETQMLRYLRRLADRDFALDRGMIPLGSCTMKLKATTEMVAISWPEFADLHPFVPADQSVGIRELIAQLEQWLCTITGYDAVSLQPNAGSQGEFAGLLAIRAYHVQRGEPERTVCLIPASAHGTNAASAVMAGLRVVVVKTALDGTVDMDDLKNKVELHRDTLAAIMVTYPSTHGVYEGQITDLCAMIHDAGGQVYVDGANLNALVGLAQPGKFGADVSHLNLHKTFCIPHGGGGPGVGPVAVRAHLAPYLPNHPLDDQAGPATGVGPVAAAPYGSAGILPISWAYVRLMGGAGLTEATRMAVLNANYVAARLAEYYPVLYTGTGGRVAHECILDLRALTKDSGVSVDDVAKRLIDYGFHAPTMSFPVAGTLMVEPTESEDLGELDRFCDAMITIRQEIAHIQTGVVDVGDSMLRHAPHTARSLAGEWTHGYDRVAAVFPAGVVPADKYWPPVGRIDGAYGDRHLLCSCPPPEAFDQG